VEFWSAVHIILRRWYIVAACAVVTCLLAVVVVKEIKPTYQASGKASVVFANPGATNNSSTGNNPFGTQNQFTLDLADAAGVQSFADSLVAAGASPTYSVDASITNATALLLTTRAATPEAALTSYNVLVKQLQSTAETMQKHYDTPPEVTFGLFVYPTSSEATQLVGSRTKALILLGVVAVLVTLSLVFLTDSIAAARGRRRSDKERLAAATGGATLSVAEDVVDLDEIYGIDHDLKRGEAAGS
jgi:hypothetical protein